METTGVVRRIDDLGRIVIPKEIRRTLGIKEGASLEIFLDKDMVGLKKHSLMNNLRDFAELYVDSINQALGSSVIITDNDSIIACSGVSKKDYIGAHISDYLEQCMVKRASVVENEKKDLSLIDNKKIKVSYVIHTIVSNGDAAGLVVILSNNDRITELENKTALVAAYFLGKHIEQ